MMLDRELLKLIFMALAVATVLYVLYRIIFILRFIRIKRFINIDKQDGQGVTSIELKRCPFCGKNLVELSEIEDDGNIYYHMVCPVQSGGCGCSTGLYEKEIDAVAAWNIRSNNEEL